MIKDYGSDFGDCGGVYIGFAEDDDGSKVIHLKVEGRGVVIFGSLQAQLYGKTLQEFGRTLANIERAEANGEELE